MATVKENLIAARALIDTPEKMTSCSMELALLAVAPKGSRECLDMLNALLEAREILAYGPKKSLAWLSAHGTHARIMALFDRAIAAQGGTPPAAEEV